MAKTIGQLTQATTLAGGDDFIIEQSGLTKRVAASVVRGGLIDANIDAAAAIAFSKLAGLDSANLLVGNGSNVATKVAVTGDVTISNAGVTAIGSSKVVTAMITDANVTPAKLSQPLTLATAQNTTSGTSIDFTGIPSWAKRITVIFSGVSKSGTSNILVRIGNTSGFVTSGYASTSNAYNASNNTAGASSTAGIIMFSDSATHEVVGILSMHNVASNSWISSHSHRTDAGAVACGGGFATAPATIDRIRLTTVNGTDTFDAGVVNIMYEG